MESLPYLLLLLACPLGMVAMGVVIWIAARVSDRGSKTALDPPKPHILGAARRP
jgi:hypothetical protein